MTEKPRTTRRIERGLGGVRARAAAGCACLLSVGVAALFSWGVQDGSTAPGADVAMRLSATVHPPLPAQLSQYWYVPDSTAPPARRAVQANREKLAEGASLISEGNAAAALPLVSAAASTSGPLADYAQYYAARALSRLSRLAEADAALSAVAARTVGALKEQATLALADVALARQDAARAEALLEDLSMQPTSAPEVVVLRLAHAEEAVRHSDHALDAYRRVYYDFALTPEATEAANELVRLLGTAQDPERLFKRELGRAEQLFEARRWDEARAAFAPLARVARGGDDEEVVALRLAECDYYLDRFRAARDGLAARLSGSREAEARFFHLTAIRGLGDRATYERLARELVTAYPASDWAAEALNNLASHYITQDDDAAADAVFRQLYRQFPRHRHAQRAAWKIGWYSYRHKRLADAADVFEQAAAAFPRADNRPAWLYWSGRARDQLGDDVTANARYRVVIADYQNSYYGRLATRILEPRGGGRVPDSVQAAPGARTPAPPVPTAAVIRELAAATLFDDALREVRYAQRVWGDSPQLQATAAWIRHQQGQGLTALERFNALRGAITTMRRAYPQFLAAGGEDLPPEVLRVIFPLDYWPLIQKYAKARNLDPYLVAALMAQESTFTPEIRSAANAYGLMQIIPATGRRLARSEGLRYTASMLTQPEANIRLGTRYFKDLVTRFGGAHFALASYNAGPNRVAQWQAEAPGLPQDEFIDNIPFPETQSYVKRILGTAEDYRRLYDTSRRRAVPD